eukprot:509780_1
MASDQTNLGIFGEGILAKHCGRNITSKFYNTSIDDAVLLTESQMANVALKNTIEFLFFLLLSVSLQTILTIYIRYMQRCCGFCDSGNDVGCRKRFARSKCANIIRYFLYTWTIILCLVVLAHFISAIYHYYSFVNDNVHFDVKAMFMEENIKFEYCDSVWGYCGTDITREHCHIAGIGNIACPALFDDQEGSIYLPFYTEDAAESVCSWVFYLLIPSNAAIFQYSILTSFILFDTVAFLQLFPFYLFLRGVFVLHIHGLCVGSDVVVIVPVRASHIHLVSVMCLVKVVIGAVTVALIVRIVGIGGVVYVRMALLCGSYWFQYLLYWHWFLFFCLQSLKQ